MAIENPNSGQEAPSTNFEMRFPPFPQPPEGVEIIPFKDYKEVGILMETSDRVERDALQIPTVAIKSVHATDLCKTNAQSGEKDVNESHWKASGEKREWWNDWEDMGRRLHPEGYDDRRPPQDRLHQAASDFIRARRPIPQKVNEIWDQIQLYIGLLQSTPVWHKTDPDKASKDNEEDDDFSDDEGMPHMKDVQVSQNASAPKKKPRPRPPYENYGKEAHQVENDEQIQDLLAAAKDAKNDKLLDFFENPEKSITTFLSYYMINQGLHFEDYRLINFPRVLGFFIKYLIINNVWPECKASLDRSQNIIDIASQELICTSKISKALPDVLNYAFRDHWSINPDVFYPSDDSDIEKPEAKRLKVDPEAADFEQSLKDANLDLIKPEDVDVLMEEAITAEESGGWKSTWDADDDAAPAPQNVWNDSTAQDWSFLVERPRLMELFGPTALPVTHTTGIVEQSMRRIAAIIPPPKDVSALPHAKDPSPEAVEAELERRFTKVVLSPWLGSKTGDDEPTISSLSKGPVLGKDDIEADTPPSGPKPHNPWKDDITIFVGEDAAKDLRVGMGLGGSWIQMARQQDFESQDKKKKKKKGKKSDNRFWYMCSLMTVLTSYHVGPSEVQGHVPDI
ncbi:uncharacterized protein BT62DRAFT_930744 [Guyanagaster necrorhizus]|uniref:Uncharacterized protein n=1 Tax=Guyanagaster necrorhizus TaxID=856835 RepID=A0A9P7VXN4_9AGAR|nr:uncharacterized protein BT62DRAFT_930744 [Guyanagaster necrorhizus MCA 3950]KAG7447716.1 hypothetical protein BT62DRAFT_930744 [Guyanagaster necrorhizus MCA 3950]